ncbi:hypothetical protein PG999_009790 [Apiospora kogelbergensis]|uniref:Uncharacterized protein n=1 Tax=Apiospora kogelbergensis TaxID=1337665 RepID=A0AAW0QU28_9PEZI
MLTNIVSQTSPGAGSLYVRASSSNALLAPVGAVSVLLGGRHHQQARSYRCGIWSSYLGPELHKHSRRRHRMVKYRYAESQNRKSSWDQNPLVSDAKTALRQAIGKYWQAGVALCGSRMVSYDSRPSPPNKEGSQEGGTQQTAPDSSSWTSPLGDVISRWTKQSFLESERVRPLHNSFTAATSSSVGNSSEDDFIIDPITNRKVVRKTYGATKSDIGTPFKKLNPTNPIEGYRTFPHVRNHKYNRAPQAELDKREEIDIDPLSAAPYNTNSRFSLSPDQNTLRGIQSEEYSLNHLPPEDQAEVYDDLNKYKSTEHDEIQDDSTEPAPKYDDLHNYRPAEHDEIKDISAKSAPKYDDLHKYQPTEHDEIKVDWEQPVQKYQDLHNYRPTEHDEITTSASQSAPKYGDLGDYKPIRYKESDATQAVPQPVYDDLHKYRPFLHNEDAPSDEAAAAVPKYEDLDKYKSHMDPADSNVDPAEPKYEDLDKYQPFLHLEGQSDIKEGSQYKDLNKYRSGVFEGAAEEGEPFEQYGDLDQYKSAYRFQEPDGKAPVEQDPVEESLEEFDAKKENRENLEKAMTSYIAVSDAFDKEVSASLQRSRQRAMQDEPSVNIFRDAPEKFIELLRENGIGSAQLDPASDAARQADVQAAEKDYSDNLAHKLKAFFVPAVGRLDATADKPAKDGNVEPTIYKVLAYDPGTQDVCIAETTSTLPDHATPLTPSEILSRLPNPTEFFPYFEPLRAEGFEIISGDGNILVFRKVREPAASTSSPPSSYSPSSEPHAASSSSSSSSAQHPVNPIDMMGRDPLPLPSAAAFASPTGFVNYNDLFVEEQQPQPTPQPTPPRFNGHAQRVVTPSDKSKARAARKEKKKKKKEKEKEKREWVKRDKEKREGITGTFLNTIINSVALLAVTGVFWLGWKMIKALRDVTKRTDLRS